jgi:eukaryotic-like serine/threonine-protein kinase
MEYVPGVPLLEYCDANRLTNPQRLELFRDICLAIHHAHQKGIIHRDLKPSNVLVEVQDGKPVPKVIDFGVAKATHQQFTERTVFTEEGVLIGTPEYMSPEQAAMADHEVDASTDIYSLGVLLYELMVGVLPFDVHALRRAGYFEIHRTICEQEPPSPAARLRALGPAAEEIAKRRRTDAHSLERQVRGDLEWITMRALESSTIPGSRASR